MPEIPAPTVSCEFFSVAEVVDKANQVNSEIPILNVVLSEEIVSTNFRFDERLRAIIEIALGHLVREAYEDRHSLGDFWISDGKVIAVVLLMAEPDALL